VHLENNYGIVNKLMLLSKLKVGKCIIGEKQIYREQKTELCKRHKT